MDLTDQDWRTENAALLTEIDRMVDNVAECAKFRMKLHIKKGGWHEAPKENLFAGLLKNLNEFYRAMRCGDRREMVNEGVDIINRINMLLDNEAYDEVWALQEHEQLLDHLIPNQQEEDCAL